MACGCDCSDITIPEGTDGVGISTVTLNGSNQLVITLTSGTIITTSAITITALANLILHNDTTTETTSVPLAASSGGTPTQIGTKGYTTPANTVTTDGSELRVTAWFTGTTTTDNNWDFQHWIYINGAWFSTSSPKGGLCATGGIYTYKIKMQATLVRKTNTTVFADFHSDTYIGNQLQWSTSNSDYADAPAALGAFNFTTTTIPIACYASYYSVDGTAPANHNISCTKFTVEYIKK